MRNTYTRPTDFWQERDFGAKISAAFEFVGAHWRPLGRVLLYLVVPAALLHSIVSALLQTQLAGVMQRSIHTYNGSGFSTRYSSYMMAFQSPLYFLNVALGIAFHTVLILSVYGYLYYCVYPAQPGEPITVPQVWDIVKRRFVGTFLALIGIWIIIVLGFVVLMLPGIYLGVALSLFFVVSVLENSGFLATISRCLSLVKGKWWSTFGLLFIAGVLVYLLLASVGVIALLSGGVQSLLLGGGHLSSSFLVVLSSLSGLITLVLYPPIMLMLAFQYFNLVERSEGLGLRQLVDKLGQNSASPEAQSSHYQPDEEGEY